MLAQHESNWLLTNATFNFVNLSARQLSCSISSLELLMQQCTASSECSNVHRHHLRSIWSYDLFPCEDRYLVHQSLFFASGETLIFSALKNYFFSLEGPKYLIVRIIWWFMVYVTNSLLSQCQTTKIQELNRTTQDQEKCNVLHAFNSTP